jgi:hypothetical protein
LNGIAISWGGCDVPGAGYAGNSRVGKVLWSILGGTAGDVADPEPWLETATLIEAMHARVFSTALKEDVVTILGPGRCERSINNGATMALTPKFGMSDHIFEKAVLLSGTQEIWRGNKHTGCNDLCVHCGYEDRNAVVGQHF